jgi:hypothetical protein
MTSELIEKVESDIRATRKIGDGTKSAFCNLDAETRAAYQQMMVFIGADMGLLDKSYRTDPIERANAAALMFLWLQIDTPEPAWSSWVLEKMIDAVLKTPKGEPIDIIRGFDHALKKYNVRLTETVAKLVKDVMTSTFSKVGNWYQAADWHWANKALGNEISPARCYLFLNLLPPEKADAGSIVAILNGLADTPFVKEALAVLSDDLERPDVKPLVQGLKLPQLQTK